MSAFFSPAGYENRHMDPDPGMKQENIDDWEMWFLDVITMIIETLILKSLNFRCSCEFVFPG